MRCLVVFLWLSFCVPVALAELGEDGLHKQEWFSLTFKDISEDIADAANEGKRHVVLFEQKGCIYCQKLHENLLSDPEISEYIKNNFTVVQMNMFGDEEVTDLDGEVLTEKQAVTKWGVMFTPLFLFMPESSDGTTHAGNAAVASLPGAFGKMTFLHMFKWVKEKGYAGEEHFQQFHARLLAQSKAGDQPAKE